jgi:hypothetical protein
VLEHNRQPGFHQITMRALIDFAAIQAPADPSGSASAPRQMPAGSAALRVAFGDPCEVLVAHELGQVKAVLQAVHERSLQGQWCVGYVRYEAAPAFDRALVVHPPTGPLVWFGVHDAPLPSAEALVSPALEAAAAPTGDTHDRRSMQPSPACTRP